MVDIYENKKAYISTSIIQAGREEGEYTCCSLLDVLNSVVDGLLSGIEVTLLARVCARGVGDLLGDGFITLWIKSVLAMISKYVVRRSIPGWTAPATWSPVPCQ